MPRQALHGAPVTTLDVDFMFRKTPTNLKKLKAIARSLDASILKPYYPVSDLFRMINDDRGLQLDFMAKIDGVRSFESLRSRATAVAFGAYQLRIASLADIIKSNAPPDEVAISPCWRSSKKHSMNKKTSTTKKAPQTALQRESERALVEQICRLLRLPMNKRTHFLRVRHIDGGSHL